MHYKKRYIEKLLKEALESIGAVLIVGPKWCGKTTTSERYANTTIELQHPTKGESYIKLAHTNPLLLFKGKKPILIDEWQMAPQIWDAVRYSVDKTGEDGLYILTGSTVVDYDKIQHSGAGRIHRLLMRPMSLYESGESNGNISLKDLFDNPNLDIDGITSDLTIEDLIFLACRGGWPETLNKKTKKSQLFVGNSYFNHICEIDTSTIDNSNRNPDLIKLILKSYARNISTLAKNTTIINDVKENHDITPTTFYNYLNVLKRLYVIKEIPAWSPNIRSKTSIRKSRKKQFIDPSIAVNALNLSPEKLLDDFKTFGFIFENLCIRDLSVYSSILNGNILYYNDKNGLEADCIVLLQDGRYGLIEFKLGSSEIEKGAKNLLKLNKIIEEKIENKQTHINKPSFLAIITGGPIAYTRKDGVKIIPIGTLK